MNDNTITLKLEIPGLMEIAAALGKIVAPAAVTASIQQPASVPQQQQSVPQQPAPVPQQQQSVPQQQNAVSAPSPQYVQQTTMVPTQQPVQQTAPVPQAPAGTVPAAGIPTTAVPVIHTMDELAVAASQLVNMGKQPRLIGILNGFGVNSLVELPQEKYSAFAGCIKAEGAKF